MHLTPENQKDPFEIAQLIIDLNRSVREQYFRELVLVAQPAVKVYEWFYKN